MPESEMVERVARAMEPGIFATLEAGPGLNWLQNRSHENAIKASRRTLRKARAAIEALRECTLEMLSAGHEASRKARVGGVSGMTIDAQLRNQCAREAVCWQAMIDEALGTRSDDLGPETEREKGERG